MIYIENHIVIIFVITIPVSSIIWLLSQDATIFHFNS